MGLALDEPRAGDITLEAEGLEFVLSESDERVIGDGRDLRVDYFADGFGRGFHVSTTVSASCGVAC